MTNFTHNIIANSANSVFSTTRHLSETEKNDLLIKYTNEHIPTEPGNIIPTFWYKVIVDEKGRPDLTAIILASEIFALYRFSSSLCPSFYKNIHEMPVLVDQSLLICYKHFTKKFCFPDEKIRRGLISLEELGIIKRDVSNIAIGKGKRCNKLLITLNVDFFLSCFRNPDKDIRAYQKGKPSLVNNKKSKSGVNEDSNCKKEKTCKDNKFQSSQVSKDLMSNKNYLKDRSMDKSNFLKNSEEKNSEIDKVTIGPKSTAQEQSQPCIRLIEQKRKYDSSKKLADFYPLTQEDCTMFQIRSNRDFDLNAMNEILLSMSRKKPNMSFYHRNGFIGYMAKVYRYELRDAVKISNGTFKVRSNMTQEEKREGEVEKYLTEIESSLQVSPEWHLKKKLACVLEQNKAYALLKAYGSLDVVGGVAKLHLDDAIDLTPLEREVILSQIKATHERYDGAEYRGVEELELVVTHFAKTKSKATQGSSKAAEIPNTVWGAMRRKLIDIYGQDRDRHWFAKLDGIVDEDSKTIKVKAPNDCFKRYVEDNFLRAIQDIAQPMGLSLGAVTC